jgi:serine/threonine protein kinase
MPLLAGESLSRILLRKPMLSLEGASLIAARIAAILHSAHCVGYVHRDVKPDHVLLDVGRQGELLVWLLDFGVCSSSEAPSDERAREQGKVFGTPSYVSPEQAAGKPDVDARADLFSLGVVLFEMLAGKAPFVDSSVSKLLLRIMREEAPRLSELVPDIETSADDIVARLLARDPEDRFPSARAVSRVLASHVGDRGRAEARMVAALRASRVRPPRVDTQPATARSRAVRQVA